MKSIPVPTPDLRSFRKRLLSWYAKSRRDLPWRRTKDAYRIWLSEVMLQQTRVAVVIPYFEKFLKTFPSVRALAHASTDRVLSKWAGLGYYSRARNMHRAAREIVSQHAGRFPRKYDAALALPGIGRYTAAAVLSIAYNEPHAVLDGNVARVLARICAIRGDLRAPKNWRQLDVVAQNLLPPRLPGDWNQAMMELGATVCLPKSPRCSDCPVAEWCLARKLGIAEKLPALRKKREAVQLTLGAAVFLDPLGRTLLVRQKNDDGALFSRMWQFPSTNSSGMETDLAIKRYVHDHFDVKADGNFAPLPPARHTVTYRSVRLEPHLIRVSELPRVPGARIVRLGQMRGLPISNATQKIANAAITAERSGEPQSAHIGCLAAIS